jgi:hypothetical protein
VLQSLLFRQATQVYVSGSQLLPTGHEPLVEGEQSTHWLNFGDVGESSQTVPGLSLHWRDSESLLVQVTHSWVSTLQTSRSPA